MGDAASELVAILEFLPTVLWLQSNMGQSLGTKSDR